MMELKEELLVIIIKSKFTTNKAEVNEKKNVYLVKPDLIEELEKGGYLDVWIDILAEYAYKWHKGEEIPVPESFKQATEEIIDTNDIIKDFIDGCLVKTNGGRKDRIGKNDMEKIYKEFYPKRGISVATLIARLRDYDIEYDKGLQAGNGVRGCFIGIKEKDSFDEEDEVMNQLYPQLSKMDKDKDDEIEELQNKILELEEMLKNNKKKQMEENKRVMKPDNEKEGLKEENKKVNECFMDAMDENKKLRKLLCKHNISYSYIDIKFNDIIDNIEENIEEDEVKPKEKTKEKTYGEEHAERQAVIIENERKKLKEQNKLLRKKEEKQKETKSKIDYDELIANNEVFNSIFKNHFFLIN